MLTKKYLFSSNILHICIKKISIIYFMIIKTLILRNIFRTTHSYINYKAASTIFHNDPLTVVNRSETKF